MATRAKSFTITGPNVENGEAPAISYNVALSYAQNMAARRHGGQPGTWYVRDPEGQTVAIVERHENRLITTTPIRGAAS